MSIRSVKRDLDQLQNQARSMEADNAERQRRLQAQTEARLAQLRAEMEGQLADYEQQRRTETAAALDGVSQRLFHKLREDSQQLRREYQQNLEQLGLNVQQQLTTAITEMDAKIDQTIAGILRKEELKRLYAQAQREEAERQWAALKADMQLEVLLPRQINEAENRLQAAADEYAKQLWDAAAASAVTAINKLQALAALLAREKQRWEQAHQSFGLAWEKYRAALDQLEDEAIYAGFKQLYGLSDLGSLRELTCLWSFGAAERLYQLYDQAAAIAANPAAWGKAGLDEAADLLERYRTAPLLLQDKLARAVSLSLSRCRFAQLLTQELQAGGWRLEAGGYRDGQERNAYRLVFCNEAEPRRPDRFFVEILPVLANGEYRNQVFFDWEFHSSLLEFGADRLAAEQRRILERTQAQMGDSFFYDLRPGRYRQADSVGQQQAQLMAADYAACVHKQHKSVDKQRTEKRTVAKKNGGITT